MQFIDQEWKVGSRGVGEVSDGPANNLIQQARDTDAAKGTDTPHLLTLQEAWAARFHVFSSPAHIHISVCMDDP